MSDAAAPRLLVVRLGSLGDLVHTLPAVAALHRARPDTAIDWLVDRVHRDFLELVPAIASIVTLDRPTLAGWRDVRRRLRAQRYEAALDFQGLLKSAALARLSGAARVAGFDRAALRERAAAWLYTERIDVGEGRHVIDKNLALAAAFGAATMPREFPLAPVTSAALETLRAQGIDRFALINCGAASLMVSGDTGPTHIAGAVGTPIVAIFGPTDPSRNGPWAADDRVVSRYEACDCHYQRVCHRSSDRWCLLDVSVEDVQRAIDARLAAAPRAAC
jgi:ADP-heptose:LPS heptosyltransferase